jgi:hypothetical protein
MHAGASPTVLHKRDPRRPRTQYEENGNLGKGRRLIAHLGHPTYAWVDLDSMTARVCGVGCTASRHVPAVGHEAEVHDFFRCPSGYLSG